MINILKKVALIIYECFKHRRCHDKQDVDAIHDHVKGLDSKIPKWYTDRDKREVRRQIRKVLDLTEAFGCKTSICRNHGIAEIIHELEMLEMKLPQNKFIKLSKIKKRK